MAPPGKTSWSFYPLHTLPAPLDIVWCHFPEAETPRSPGPKARPALVRAFQLNKAQTKALLEVTFGTSRLRTGERLFDLIISNSQSLDACGLPCHTRFDLDKTLLLPWAKEYFVPRKGYSRTPIIGSLDAQSRMQLETLKVLRRSAQTVIPNPRG